MKKLLSIVLVMLMLATLLASCSKPVNTDTDSQVDETNTDTESNVNTDDTETDSNSPILPEPPEPQPEPEPEPEPISMKTANQIMFNYTECENIYYERIENYKITGNVLDFPEKDGAYFKIFDSYDELTRYIIPTELDKGVFEDNYVICIYAQGKTHNADGPDQKSIGFYDFKFENGEYSVSKDFYFSRTMLLYPAYSMIYPPPRSTNYVIVPKVEIDYVKGIQEMVLNKNRISNKFHWYIEHGISTDLPKDAESWVVNEDDLLCEKFGLFIEQEPYNYHFGIENDIHMVLYLPNEPSYDFIITEKEIKNGDLYLTVEAYTTEINGYLNKNDVKFYDLLIEDTSLLSDNYNIYITVNKIAPPTI